MTDEGVRTAPLSKRWVRKMVIFLVVLIGFGGLGLYDAVIKYPERGERFASWAEWQYLQAAKAANAEDFGVFERDSSVPSPDEEYARLSGTEQSQRNASDARNTSSSRRLRAIMQEARLAWLRGLRQIGRLDPAHTTIENPRQRLDELNTLWGSAKSNPKALAGYDIPSQWAIVIVCWGIAAVMVVHFFRVAGAKYRWEASTMTLTLPDGAALTPDDLEEVDKRKWDKFIVFLKVKPGHSKLGGQEVRCDTYQHDELEGWILAMEEKAFGPQEGVGESGVEPESV